MRRWQRSLCLIVENVQVFILAENRLLREALTRILSKKSDIQVVGASAFSPDVVAQISSAGPDVLLSDSAAIALSDLTPDFRSTRSDPWPQSGHDRHGGRPMKFSARRAGWDCGFRAEGRFRHGSRGGGSFRGQS